MLSLLPVSEVVLVPFMSGEGIAFPPHIGFDLASKLVRYSAAGSLHCTGGVKRSQKGAKDMSVERKTHPGGEMKARMMMSLYSCVVSFKIELQEQPDYWAVPLWVQKSNYRKGVWQQLLSEDLTTISGPGCFKWFYYETEFVTGDVSGYSSYWKTTCWPNGLQVHLSGDLQAVEPLHVADSIGQDLSRSHGWHLSAGLGQVTVHPQPGLERHTQEEQHRHHMQCGGKSLESELITLPSNNKTELPWDRMCLTSHSTQTWSNLRSKLLSYDGEVKKQSNKRWLQLPQHSDVTEICFGTHAVNGRNETCGVLQPLRTFSRWNDSFRKYTTKWRLLYLTAQCSTHRAGGADRREGENVIFDPIADDAKSVPPVMQKPNISHTHDDGEADWDTTHEPIPCGGARNIRRHVSAWVCAHGCSCVNVRLLVYLLLCEKYLISCIYIPTPFKSQLTHFSLSLSHTQLVHKSKYNEYETQHFHLHPLKWALVFGLYLLTPLGYRTKSWRAS